MGVVRHGGRADGRMAWARADADGDEERMDIGDMRIGGMRIGGMRIEGYAYDGVCLWQRAHMEGHGHRCKIGMCTRVHSSTRTSIHVHIHRIYT